MPEDISSLVVSLEAKLTSYEQAFAKAHKTTVANMRKIQRAVEQDATKIERRMAVLGNGIKAGFIGALGGLTIGNAVSKLNEVVKKYGDIADAAEKAGTSAEFLQSLNAVGRGVGIEFEGVVDLITKFNLELGKAAVDGGKLADVLAANGISIRDANGQLRSQEQMFFSIVDLISRARSQQEAAYLAQLAFGKASKESLALLTMMPDEIRRGMEAAKASGEVVDEELVKAADEFGNRWAAAWATFEGRSASAILTAMNAIDQLIAKAEPFFAAGDSAAVSLYKGAMGYTPPPKTFGDPNTKGTGRYFAPPPVIPQKSTSSSGTGRAGVTPLLPSASEIRETTTELETLLDTMEEVDQAFLDSRADQIKFQDAFKDTWSEIGQNIAAGKVSLDDFQGSLDNLRSKLLQIALDKSFELLFGDIQSGQQGLLQNLMMPTRAAGGPVSKGRAYKVGEHGAEVFRPAENGRIESAAASRAMGGSGQMPIIVEDHAGVRVTATQEGSGDNRRIRLMLQQLVAAEVSDPYSPTSRGLNGRGAKMPTVRR